MTISRVAYQHGMVQSVKKVNGLQEIVFSEDEIPAEVLAAINENHLLDVGGTYGDSEAGEPIQYDHLLIEHSSGKVEITFYNRGISLVFGNNETERQIHRVCSILERRMRH